MNKNLKPLGLAIAAALGGPVAQAHVANHDLNQAPRPVTTANGHAIADPCADAASLCQSSNNFTRYGWEGGTTPFLEDSHYVTTNADEFDFHLDRPSTVTIEVRADSVDGATLNPAFSVYKGLMPLGAHDDEANSDPLNPTDNSNVNYPPIISPKDTAPGDPNIAQFLALPDYTTPANPAWTAAVAGQYAALYTAHNGYRDTLNHTPLGDYYASYHGQFDAFGDWSMANDDGEWAEIHYIASVSETPCSGPNCGTTTTGGFENPGHVQGNAGLTETLTLKLAAGDYAIWAGGESGVCSQGQGRGTCYSVVGGTKTDTLDPTIPGVRAYATVRITSIVPIPPTANAGADIAVDENTEVTLSGAQSTDALGGHTLTYKWTQTSGPTVTLLDPATGLASNSVATPRFTAPLVDANTVLGFDLVVTDGNGVNSSADSVAVTVRDNASGRPSANAGADQTVESGATVTLDGRGSSDPTPGQAANLIYHWQQIGTPAVALSANDSAAARQTTFTAPAVAANTVLSFSLTVTDPDGNDSADPATVNITVKKQNHAPVADAGDGQTVRAGSLVTLDGGNSQDPDGDSLGYAWTAPAGITLSDPKAQKPTFAAPLALAGQTLTFSLKVDDGKLDSAASQVAVKLTADNNPPTVAIIPQTLQASPGDSVTLNASVTDPDGDGIASYLWQQTGGTPVVLDKVDGPSLSFTAPNPSVVDGSSTQLSFSLTATDDFTPNPLSATATTNVGVIQNLGVLDCSTATAQPARLFPANKGMKSIAIVGITTPTHFVPTGSYTVDITGVTADEPIKAKSSPHWLRALGLAHGTGPAAVIVPAKAGSAQDSVLLRADRKRGKAANGRVYTVYFTATPPTVDGGAGCSGTVTVQVPTGRDRAAIDDGQNFTPQGRR
ncbi:PKD domain-containing protein [Methylomagnum ishizawai]|uniref:PKD domain-containing protein n=1 Tax=Methylomagnum ishizawai TaxID=1760988 RepID=UPI001C7FC8C1|nr:PKD domain-containing protein [Methylomagnum ishizawai]